MPVSDQFFLDTLDSLGSPDFKNLYKLENPSKIRKVLPQSYFEFIETYGLGSYFDRGIQFCDPDIYRPILEMIFDGDAQFDAARSHVVSFTAFGQLTVWSEDHDDLTIDLVDGQVFAAKIAPSYMIPIPGIEHLKRSEDPNVLARAMLPYDELGHEAYDVYGDPLFKRCVATHGALKRGECYGFFPAIAMAGPQARILDNVQRVSALEHFAILSQLSKFALVRMDEHQQFDIVRTIG